MYTVYGNLKLTNAEKMITYHVNNIIADMVGDTQQQWIVFLSCNRIIPFELNYICNNVCLYQFIECVKPFICVLQNVTTTRTCTATLTAFSHSQLTVEIYDQFVL